MEHNSKKSRRVALVWVGTSAFIASATLAGCGSTRTRTGTTYGPTGTPTPGARTRSGGGFVGGYYGGGRSYSNGGASTRGGFGSSGRSYSGGG